MENYYEKQSFQIILNTVNSISSVGHQDQCQAVVSKLGKVDGEMKNLCELLEKRVDKIDQNIRDFKDELNSLHKKEVRYTNKKNELTKNQSDLQAQYTKLEYEQRSLNNELNTIRNQIRENEAKIEEEERKREEGVTQGIVSLVPLVGVFFAIKDDDPRKLIPGYSYFSALISVLSQEKENLERRCRNLRGEKSRIEEAARRKRAELQTITNELDEVSQELMSVKNRIAEIERYIQRQSRDLTTSSNVVKDLKVLRQNFLLLKNDLSVLKECAKANELDMSEFFCFSIQLNNINSKFLAIEQI